MSAELIKWDRMKFEIAQAKDITVLSKLNYSLEAMQQWAKSTQQSLETQNEIAEYRLRLKIKMGKWLNVNIPKVPKLERNTGGVFQSPVNSLKNAGINRNESPKLRTLAEVTEETFDEYVSEKKKEQEEITQEGLVNRIKQKQKDERIDTEKQARGKSVSSIEIRKGDFKKVLDDVYDIDAIITDPPYPKEFIECFSDLSLYAKTHLKEKGWLAVYSGQYNLPEVIERLSEHLTYVWTFCLYHVGKKQLVNGVNIMCGWKPILIFSKGHKKMRFSVYDVIESLQREKHSHEWQQSESGVLKLIEAFSEPGQLIVDPFSGSGTFCKIAIKNGRRAIGAELND